MKYVAGIALVLFLSACSTAKTIPLPSGKQGYVVENCRPANCYKRAAKLCGGRYDIVSEQSSTTGFITGGVGFAAPRHALVVSCP